MLRLTELGSRRRHNVDAEKPCVLLAPSMLLMAVVVLLRPGCRTCAHKYIFRIVIPECSVKKDCHAINLLRNRLKQPWFAWIRAPSPGSFSIVCESRSVLRSTTLPKIHFSAQGETRSSCFTRIELLLVQKEFGMLTSSFNVLCTYSTKNYVEQLMIYTMPCTDRQLNGF